jgi:3-oxoacyl-[acyl-carrier protein] reductase
MEVTYMGSLNGKTALVTGAGRGIGRATAIALSKEGVNVGMIGLNLSNLEKVSQELAPYNVNVSAAAADISDLEAVHHAVDHIKSDLGAIDILVNNAGIAQFGGFMDLSPEEWERVLMVNVMGVYNVTRAVLPEMIERKTGDIVNIASSAGQRGAPVTSAYSASKFAVLGLSESLMLEVRKHNIRVTALAPSTVATDLAYETNLINGDPEKVMHPEDLADLIVAGLKLHPRVVLKTAGLWSTNP